ncbi:OB-fold protein [Sphingosinicella terrae]|uniref:OB-fold protein n=1 Tax=Sphingosinicella terrae TaxID=2172047 RepID=UPI0013B3EC03|nr:hypothetical protein [Sphingosinicella terrae]
MPPQAEFCQRCGMPTRMRLRERSPTVERSEDELKRNRRTFFIAAAAFFFGIVVGGQSSWFDANFDFDDHRPRPAAVIAAGALFDAYEENEDEAEERFDDRAMVVTGEYVRTVPDGQGHPDLRFLTADPERPIGADIIAASHEEASRLQPGQTVTVSCQGMAGDRDDRWLRNCSIEIVAPAAATPAAAPPAGTTPPADAAPPAESTPPTAPATDGDTGA